MKYIKRALISSLIISLLMLIGGYAFFPSIAAYLIEQKLPDNLKLINLKVERPSLNQLKIENLKLKLIKNQSGSIAFNGIDINYSLTSLEIVQINVKNIQAELSEISDNEETDKTTLVPISELNIPPTFIESFSLTSTVENYPKININGNFNLSNLSIGAKINVDSDDKTIGAFSLNSENKSDFYVNGQLINLDLTNLKVIEQLTKLPISDYSGRLDGEYQAHIKQSLDGFNIEAIKSTLQLSKVNFSTENINFTQVSGEIILNKRDFLNIEQSSIQGYFNFIEPMPLLKKERIHFSGQIKSLSLTNNAIFSNIDIKLDNEQLFELKSEIPLNPSVASKHKVNIQIYNLDQSWSPIFENISFNKLGTTFDFKLLKDGNWYIENLKNNDINFEEFHYKNKIISSVKKMTISPNWKPRFSFSDIPFKSIILGAKDLELQSLDKKASTKIDLESKLIKNKNTYLLSTLYKSSSESNSVSITGSFSGIFSTQSEDNSASLTFTTKNDLDIFSIREILKTYLPQQIEILDTITINKDHINISLDISGKMEDLSESFLENIELSGKLESKSNTVILADNEFSNTNIDLNWNKRSWRTPSLKVNTTINYLKKDLQQHNLESNLSIYPEIKIGSLKYSSNMLNGKIFANTQGELTTISNLSGLIRLESIDLSKVSEIMNDPKLKMTGIVSGEIPFSNKNGVFHLNNGKLDSSKGTINYLPEGKKIALTQENISNIANITLQNFHFDLMKIKLDHGSPCEFDIKIRLEGRNPDLGSDKNQAFNINYNPKSNVNLLYLLLLGQDNIQKLNKEKLYSGCVNN
ncbi:intermembrane phospholipid transport protein YdbH family protein [Pleionea sediminis]|uniref:intermembrane phospholipid transport protein YdbH family protein n=1 Tax=Pleionea sediminis TaxID=2569479 RepID=UPI001184AB3F|nr:YdbH domain-containing protein [Pleionea sediminis]